MNKSQLQLSACAHQFYPADVFFCVLWGDGEDCISLHPERPIIGEWGISQSLSYDIAETKSVPTILDMVWLSVIEEKTYSVEHSINKAMLATLLDQIPNSIDSLLVGIAPYGRVALWALGKHKSTLLGWYMGNECEVEPRDFYNIDFDVSFSEVCQNYIDNNHAVKINFEKNGLPSHDLFDNYMKRFVYRYQLTFGNWDEGKRTWISYDTEKCELIPELEFIEEILFDGTFDKLHDGELMKYHEAGKPKKLALKWHIKRSDYSAYFWFDDEKMCSIFERFYGAHPNTKTDFIIRIDAEKRKYELALYRYGLKEPQLIPEDVYQLLVFKNKFEDYRSDNYNQERGAWIW